MTEDKLKELLPIAWQTFRDELTMANFTEPNTIMILDRLRTYLTLAEELRAKGWSAQRVGVYVHAEVERRSRLDGPHPG